MRIRWGIIGATLIVLVLLNVSTNSASFYSSIEQDQPCAVASACPACKTTTVSHAQISRQEVGSIQHQQHQASFLRKRSSILYVVDVRTAPVWQQVTIRKRLEGRAFFIFVALPSLSHPNRMLNDDTLVVAKQADEYAIWNQVHRHIQSVTSPEWILQIHADTVIDIDGTALHLTTSELRQRTEATVLGCAECLPLHHNNQSSSSTSIASSIDNESRFNFQQFRSWAPLIFNQAASLALVASSNQSSVTVSTINVPDLISDRSWDHCHYQNESVYLIRKCHTWPTVQRIEISEVTNTTGEPIAPMVIQTHQTTVVTAFFPLNAKHGAGLYHRWMQTMLSIQEPVVVFVPIDEVERIKKCRQHALNRTIIIPMNLTNLPVANLFPIDFWEYQLEIDSEKKIHKDYRVFWIWLSKSWWIQEAIRLNPFQSEIFLWSDIGSFRYNTDDRYADKYVVRYPELVPRHSLLQMSHHTFNVNPDVWMHNKRKRFFFHSGSQAVAYHDTWIEYHRELQVTLNMFIKRGYFIGEDQILMQHTCIRTTPLCLYVNSDEVDDDHYFGLKYILHFGGDHQYMLTPTLANLTYSADANHQIAIDIPSSRGPGTRRSVTK